MIAVDPENDAFSPISLHTTAFTASNVRAYPSLSAAPPRVSLASVSANVALAICAHSSPCFPCPSNTPTSTRPVSRRSTASFPSPSITASSCAISLPSHVAHAS